LPNRFFAVVDRDRQPTDKDDTTVLSWDVYHIENYLLHAESLRRAANSLLSPSRQIATDEQVMSLLRNSAERSVNTQVMELVQAEVNRQLVSTIAIGGPPDSSDAAADLVPSIEGSVKRFNEAAGEIGLERLREMAERHRAELTRALETDEWARDFPGRPILRQFVDAIFNGKIAYSLFVNAVLDKMAEASVQPEGMRTVLRRIVDA